MYVCVCKNITEDRLQNELKKGKCPTDLERSICAGADCGACLVFAKEKIQEILAQIQTHSTNTNK